MDTIMQQLYRPAIYTRPVAAAVIYVAIYVRISFDRHGKRYGVSDQIKDLIALIESIPGLEVGEIFEDNDVSAFNKEVERENYNRLIAEIKAGKYTVVACVRASRLVRQRRQRAEFIDLMESVAGKVYTTDGTIYDFTSEVGRGAFDSDGAKDTSESEKISVRTTRAHVRQAEAGKYAGGALAYGLERHLEIVDGKVEKSVRINEPEAAILREAARRVLAGETIHAVSMDFNRRRVPTAQGGKWWDPAALRNMLLRPGIAGLRAHKSRDNITADAEWEAIITVDEWMAVKSTLESRSTDRRKTGTDVSHLLAGFLTCDTCKHKMKANTSGRRVPTYRCLAPAPHCARKMTIAADPLENLIGDLLTARLAQYADYTASETPSRAAAKVAELTAKMESLAAEWLAGEMTDKAYGSAHRAADEQLEKFRTEAEREAKARIVLPGPHAATAWASGTIHERRALLEMLIKTIEIRPDDQTSSHGNRFNPDRVHVVWRTLDGTSLTTR